MANRKVTLVAHIKTAQGWRRYPVAWGKNGRIKPGTVIVGGKEQKFTEGVYQLRTYKGSRMVYKSLPNDNAQDAVNARDRESALLAAREHATEAGAKIVEPESRKYLRRAIELYKQDRENRNALEAKEQAALVGDEFLTVSGVTFVDEVTVDSVYRFHKALRQRGCASRTLANKHARLKSILLYAGVDKSVIPPAPKYEKTLPTIYEVKSVGALHEKADEYMRLVIDLGLMCGLREQEMQFLEWGDIDLAGRVLRVQGKPQRGFLVKDSEQRDVTIPTELLKELKAYRKKHPKARLVLGTGKDGETPNGHLLRNLKQLARRAGLNCGECEGCKELNECRQWTLHRLRRTFATNSLRGGVDLRTVQHLMGHADLASTLRYLRPASGDEVQDRMNAIQWR
ncbi:MAG TPA: site-specific integrase [Terracidiphilus sp.]